MCGTPELFHRSVQLQTMYMYTLDCKTPTGDRVIALNHVQWTWIVRFFVRACVGSRAYIHLSCALWGARLSYHPKVRAGRERECRPSRSPQHHTSQVIPVGAPAFNPGVKQVVTNGLNVCVRM